MQNYDSSPALCTVFQLISQDTCEKDILEGLHQLVKNDMNLNSVYGQCTALHNSNDNGMYHNYSETVGTQHQQTMSYSQPVQCPGTCLSILQAACLYKRVESVRFLLQHNVNLSYKDQISGCTAMFYAVTIVPTACASQNNSTVLNSILSILKLLLEHGADISDTDRTGGTLLHHLVFSAYFQKIRNNSMCYEQNFPGLHCEVLRYCFPPILDFLYTNVAFRILQIVNHVDADGYTALMRAAQNNPWMIPPMLQQFHTYLNLSKRDLFGNTVMHILFHPILPIQPEAFQSGTDVMLFQRNLIRNCQRSGALRAILATKFDFLAKNAMGATCFDNLNTQLLAQNVQQGTNAQMTAFQSLLTEEQRDLKICIELLDPISKQNTRDKIFEFMSANHHLLPENVHQQIATFAMM